MIVIKCKDNKLNVMEKLWENDEKICFSLSVWLVYKEEMLLMVHFKYAPWIYIGTYYYKILLVREEIRILWRGMINCQDMIETSDDRH